jgi:hypothetical protein
MSGHERFEPVIVGFLCTWYSYWRQTLDDIASAVPTQHSASAHDMNCPALWSWAVNWVWIFQEG